MSDIVSPTSAGAGVPGLSGVPERAQPLSESDKMRHLAQEFEASFLAEMLKHTGLGRMPESFNGGAGEAAFSDFLTREYAAEISRSQSIGLADQIYRALIERSGQ